MNAPSAVTDQQLDIYAHLARDPNPSAYCPHCGGVGKTNPSAEFYAVCGLCGGPRIRMPEDFPLPDAAKASLKLADGARKSRGLMRGLFGLGVAGTLGGLLLGAPIAFLSTFVATLVVVFVAAPSLAMALFARARASSKDRELKHALDAAWSEATAALVSGGKVKNASDLVRETGVSANRASDLLSILTVDTEIGSAGAQLRIAEAPPTPLPADPRFAALEAEAEREAAAETEADTHEAEAEQQAKS